MKRKINNATATQLAKFASIQFGIDVAHQKGKEHIVGLLRNVGYTGDEIEIADEHGGPSTSGELVHKPAIQGETVAPARAGKKRRMVTITIMEQDTPGSSEGKEPVKVSVNGSLMYIPRGKPVQIPYEYYHVLQNANFRQFDMAPDEFTVLGESREVPRFPITVHEIDPEPEAVAA